MDNTLSNAEINSRLGEIVDRNDLTSDRIKALTALRLDRMAFKLEREITARGIADSDKPLSDSALLAFSLLQSAMAVAACGLDSFTEEELTAFEGMADTIIKACRSD